MNAAARKQKSRDAIREEFNQLLARLGDSDLESLIEYARRRYGDKSRLGAKAEAEDRGRAAAENRTIGSQE